MAPLPFLALLASSAGSTAPGLN
eukprot:COSAG03_NODE_13764_length_489_cov_0.917949_1_plen_22_part_01